MDARLEKQPHVVIIGAGFGGLRTALALSDKPVQVTLIDRNNYHLFQPLLYQVATSTLAPNEIAYPVRATLHQRKNLAFHMGAVESIDLKARCVRTNNGDIPYDDLVIAVGGETNYFGNSSVAENSFGLKDLEEATAMRNHILSQFEQAVAEPDPRRRQAMLTFVVVGGGPTGVESAGAIAELVRTVLHKDHPTLNVEDVHVILLEATGRLLGHLPEDLGENTLNVLRRKHVDVQLNCAVEGYDGQIVRLQDGSAIQNGGAIRNGSTIPTHTLIWAAGVRASGLLNTLALPQDRMGRIIVEPTLQVPGHPEMFVVGDAASFIGEDGKPLPMLAPVAMQQAAAVAKNILRQHWGQPLKAFVYHDPGVMATIGRSQAVALIGRWKFRGFIAWLLWLGVHIIQLIGFRNRLAVLIDWAWSYLFYERAARLVGPG